MSIVSFIREAIANRRAAGLSDYARAVVNPQAFKAKDAAKFEQTLADVGRTVEQLEADISAYQRAQELKALAATLPDATKAYSAATGALSEYDAETAGETGKRKAILTFLVTHQMATAGSCAESQQSVEQYEVERKRGRAPLEQARADASKVMNRAKAAAADLKAATASLAAVGVPL
jgi:hypothetical protein